MDNSNDSVDSEYDYADVFYNFKNPNDYGASAEAAVLMFSDDYCTKTYIDSYFNVKTHKTNASNLKLTEAHHKEIHNRQIKMYINSRSPECPFR